MLFACTIASRNYLAYLRVFTTAFLERNPSSRVIACIVGRRGPAGEFASEPFEAVYVENLGIERFEAMAFRYDMLELSTAIKPFLLDYLRSHLGAEQACYFDPDILVLDDLGELYALVAAHDLVLTPHVTERIEDNATPGEIDLLQSGIYNLGFAGVRFNATTVGFLEWWKDRLYTHCRQDIRRGLFVDQKWMDFAPSLVADTFILRDPGYNVAYWNLRHRAIERIGDRWTVNGRPLRFFHYSGLDLSQPERISKYQPETSVDERPDVAPLLAMARERLVAAGHETLRRLPLEFNTFDDGTPVPRSARSVLRDTDPRGERWPNPFRTEGPDTFFRYLATAAADDEGIPHIPAIAMAIYDMRPDVRKAFPDPLGGSRSDFAFWLITDGAGDYHLPDEWIERTRAELPARFRRRAARSGLQRRMVDAAMPLYLRVKRWNPALAASLKARFRPESNPTRANGDADELPTGSGLNVIGWLEAPTGVGEVARSFVQAASAAGIPHSAWVLDSATRSDDVSAPYDVSLFCANADMIVDVTRRVPVRGRWKVGMWFWELSHLPVWYSSSFNVLDELWAPTRFCQEAFLPLAPIPVRHVPPCVAPPRSAAPLRPAGAEGRFVFFFTFDVRSVPERKNPLGLLAAFRRAALDSPRPLHLVLRLNHAGDDPDLVARLQKAATGLPVTMLTGAMTRESLDGYFAGCDAYVALHRSEGFGIPLIEAMYAGKPVIATRYGGVTDFLDESTGWCVPHNLVQLDRSQGPYPKGAVWAAPRVDAAAELMLAVASGGETNQSRIEAARARVLSTYSPEAAGRRIAAELDRLRRS